MPKKSPQAAEGRRPGAAEDAEPGEAGRSLYLCSTNNCMKETPAQKETKLTSAQRKIRKYDDENAMAALVILLDPAGHAGLPLEWAQATQFMRDKVQRRFIQPKLEKIGLGWVTFQVMRRTNASLGHKRCVDPKVAADQRGHGIGVSMDHYTKADLAQKLAVVSAVDAGVVQ